MRSLLKSLYDTHKAEIEEASKI